MNEYSHPTKYRFYAQRWPDSSTTYPKVDIEQEYNARFMRFTDFELDGNVGNVYTESFAEKSGVSAYIPPKSDLAHQSYDCRLKLLFKGSDVQANVRRFTEDWTGVKLQYYDTFRCRYAVMMMTKTPSIVSQRLYSSQQFAEVEFTFSNIEGKTFSESQL